LFVIKHVSSLNYCHTHFANLLKKNHASKILEKKNQLLHKNS
jgi:hypothetical protein